MFKTFIAVLLVCMFSVANAAGGKNRVQNPVIPDDGCIYLVPEGLNQDRCDSLPASDSSLSIYLCSVTVVCDQSEEDEEEYDERSYLWSD